MTSSLTSPARPGRCHLQREPGPTVADPMTGAGVTTAVLAVAAPARLGSVRAAAAAAYPRQPAMRPR